MEITELIAGDSVRFVVRGGEYPASAGWSMSILLKPRAGGTDITLESTADGDDFVVAIPASETDGWAPGAYTWWQRVDKAGERYTVERGELTIRALTGDGRSVARKALDDLLAARASWVATNGRVASYKIAGREMVFRDPVAIDKEIAFWQRQVDSGVAADRIRRGLPVGGRFYVRATR